MHLRRAILILALGLAAGCSPASTDATGPVGSTAVGGAAIGESLAGSDQLVVQFTYEGGLADVPYDTLIPPFSLYADGTLLVPGNESSVSALRPVIRPVDVIRATNLELDTIYGLVAAIGLPDIDNEHGTIPFPGGTVADAGSAVVRYIDAAGRLHRYSVHAFGQIGELAAPEPVLQMKELLDLLDTISKEAGRRAPVTPNRIQLALIDEPNTGGLELPWPLEVEPGDFSIVEGIGPCIVLEDAEVTEALAAFADRGQRTAWNFEGTRWRLWGRHLLKGETGCAEPEG